MSASHDENSTPASKVLRVRQAANTLGISERTVYRRLRSGKLEQLPTEIPITDNVMTYVSELTVNEVINSHLTSMSEKIACQIDMTNDNLTNLRQELASRDAQIRTLLENQQELTHTIQKLQAQIYELARLALTQTPKTEEKSVTTPLAVDSGNMRLKPGLKSLFRSFWNRDRKG